MEVKVLGCYGGEMPGHRTTCLMINENVMIDAGAVTSALTIEQQLKVDAIVLSHSHLDHVRDLGFLADNIFGQRDKPIRIYGLPETIANIRAHVLNNSVWPDFSVLPTPENSVITLEEIQEGQAIQIEGIKFTPYKVNHTVATSGFVVENGNEAFVFSGDTGPTENIWEQANKLDSIKALFLEVSFPDRLAQLAEASGHLTPKTAIQEIKKLGSGNLDVYAFHMKPQYLKEIIADMDPGQSGIKPLEQGDQIKI